RRGLFLIDQVLEVETAVFPDHDARVCIIERHLVDAQTEGLHVALDLVELQAFPFQQVLLVNCIYAVEGAYSGAALKTATRLTVFQGNIQIHGGVHIAADNVEIEGFREVGFEVPDGQPTHAYAPLVTEGERRYIAAGLECSLFAKGGRETKSCGGKFRSVQI